MCLNLSFFKFVIETFWFKLAYIPLNSLCLASDEMS